MALQCIIARPTLVQDSQTNSCSKHRFRLFQDFLLGGGFSDWVGDEKSGTIKLSPFHVLSSIAVRHNRPAVTKRL